MMNLKNRLSPYSVIRRIRYFLIFGFPTARLMWEKMPSCSKCGAMADQGATQCPRCGALLDSGISSGRSGTASSLQYGQTTVTVTRKKPTGARVLTALFALGGINALYLAFEANPILGLMPIFPAPSYPFGPLVQGAQFFMAFLGILSLVTGFGLVRLGKWAWKLGLIVSLLGILSIVVSNYLGAIFGLATIYFLSRQETRVWFRRV